MSLRVQALVRPDMLIWARESAGLSPDVAARKAQVKAERLNDWEAGVQRPTVKQLRKLARVYRRPLAVFYLPEPPTTFKPLHDFRRLSGVAAAGEQPELRYAVRRAHERREIALELYGALGESPPEFELAAALSEDSDLVAARLRGLLSVDHKEQLAWSSPYDALNGWRSALERAGVLVFQVSRVDPTEMRAFSIADRPLPVIAVNIKDAPHARVFSMLHELAHLAMRQGGLCDLHEEGMRSEEEQRAEIACNMIAGAVLVPGERLMAEDVVRAKRGASEWGDEELVSLSRRYGVSREVILRRLLLLGRTSQAFYRKKALEMRERAASRPERAPGFPPPHALAVSTAGHLFARLVLRSYYEGSITSRDVSDFLEIRLQHMSRVEQVVLGRTVAFGAVA